MSNYGKTYKNSEHYNDNTCGEAIGVVDRSDVYQENFNKVLKTVLYVCDLAGFRIQGQLCMRCKKNNKVYFYKK
jgi:hypothetical protein